MLIVHGFPMRSSSRRNGATGRNQAPVAASGRAPETCANRRLKGIGIRRHPAGILLALALFVALVFGALNRVAAQPPAPTATALPATPTPTAAPPGIKRNKKQRK